MILPIVALSGLYIVLLKIEKKNHPKNASHLKNNTNSSHGKRYKKDIEKEEKMKIKVQQRKNDNGITYF